MADAADDNAEVQFKYLWDRRAAIQVRALMSRYYYQDRQRIFETREGVIKIIAILGGSLAFSRLVAVDISQWCAALITVSGAASLVFGFGTKARDSAKRSAEWALLERDIELAGQRDFDESNLNNCAARCNEIESGEPAMHPCMKEECYLRACASLGQEPIGSSSLPKWRLACPPIVIH